VKAPQQLPLPTLPRPAAEIFFEKWRAIFGTKVPQPKGMKCPKR
jgi:hypothetical protein